MNFPRHRMPGGRCCRPQPDPLITYLENNPPEFSTLPIEPALPMPEDSPAANITANDQVMNTSVLSGAEVTIFGAGSVGSHLAALLGPARLHIHVFDFKTVEAKHCRDGRTLYENSQIGSMKVDALQEKIEREYPGSSVHPFPYNVGEVPDRELLRLMQRSLLVVLALDDPVQILRIHDLAYPVVETIHLAMHRQAASGHIVLTIPFVTPCLRCTLGLDDSRQIRQLHGEPGNGWHIRRVAHEGAAVALDLMYAKITGQAIQRWNTECNLIYIANSRQEISPDGPGQHYEASQRRPGCRLCNIHPAV